jgi:Na+/proline symporter
LPELDFKVAVIIVAVFIVIYTALAGMFSVAYTDLAMGITMIIGIFVTLPYVWFKAGGYAGLAAQLPPDHMKFIGPISWVQPLGSSCRQGCWCLGMQICFSASSQRGQREWRVARRSGCSSASHILEMMIIFTALGLFSARMARRQTRAAGRVIAYVARDHLPVALGALVLTTIISIIISTAISYLLVPATAIVRDIYQRFINPESSERGLVWMLRGFVSGLGALALFYLDVLGASSSMSRCVRIRFTARA